MELTEKILYVLLVLSFVLLTIKVICKYFKQKREN